jgi:hypothetical protein
LGLGGCYKDVLPSILSVTYVRTPKMRTDFQSLK